MLRPPGLNGYVEALSIGTEASEEAIALRNDSFKKAVAHAEAFIYGT